MKKKLQFLPKEIIYIYMLPNNTWLSQIPKYWASGWVIHFLFHKRHIHFLLHWRYLLNVVDFVISNSNNNALYSNTLVIRLTLKMLQTLRWCKTISHRIKILSILKVSSCFRLLQLWLLILSSSKRKIFRNFGQEACWGLLQTWLCCVKCASLLHARVWICKR